MVLASGHYSTTPIFFPPPRCPFCLELIEEGQAMLNQFDNPRISKVAIKHALLGPAGLTARSYSEAWQYKSQIPAPSSIPLSVIRGNHR